MKKFKLAIIGVTGLVGQTLIEVLKEEGMLEYIDLVLFASKKSCGKRMIVQGQEYKIFELTDDFETMKIDYAIFSAGAQVSKCWAEKFAGAGVVVIDNTSAFRLNKDVPLIVPEINDVKDYQDCKLISNPNCSTIQLVLVLDRLRMLSKIDRVDVSTYQSVSGAGRRALFDLANGTTNVFENGIKNNIIPYIGEIDKSGFCAEEQKIMKETGKILNDKKMQIVATTVRVPISNCHCESVTVKFSDKVKVADIYKALKCDYLEASKQKMYFPKEVKGQNKTFVCRIRQVSKCEIVMFIVADNLRRGAAYNAVGILKELIKVKES